MKKSPGHIYPHAEAVAAMYLWGDEYGPSRFSAMEFYDQLPRSRKLMCKDLIDDVLEPGRKRAPALTSHVRQEGE